jgi:hypothetical protein
MQLLRLSRIARMAALLSLTAWHAALAQTIVATVVDSLSGAPRPGITSQLLAMSDSVVDVDVSNVDGRVMLAARGEGTYRVRLLRIGFVPQTTAAHAIARADTLRLDLRLSASPVALDAIRIQQKSECGAMRPANGPALQLWDEARKTLYAAQATQLKRRFSTTVRDYVKETDPRTGRLIRLEESRRSGLTRSPYYSLAPATLLTEGYVQDVDGHRRYFAPDVETLLSVPFVETHCFWSVKHDSSAELIGLAFKPVRRNRNTDVRGTLWLDIQNGALRYLDFTYEPLPAAFVRLGVGGRLEFAAAVGGGWIIQRWYVRAPQMASGNRTPSFWDPTSMQPMSSASVASLVEEGGEIVPVGRAALIDSSTRIQLSLLAPTETCAGVTTGAVSGSVRVDGKIVLSPTAVTVRWKEWLYTSRGLSWISRSIVAYTDTSGNYRACGVPAPGRITLQLLPSGPVDSTDIRQREVARFDIARSSSAPHADAQEASEGFVARSDDLPVTPVSIVNEPIVTHSWRADYERRKATLPGVFLTAEDVERRRVKSTTDLLAYLPGFDKTWVGMPHYDFMISSKNRRGIASDACPVTYYVNGVKQVGNNSQLFVNVAVRPPDIAAIEGYADPTTIPPQFSAITPGCGVVVIWTHPTIGSAKSP